MAKKTGTTNHNQKHQKSRIGALMRYIAFEPDRRFIFKIFYDYHFEHWLGGLSSPKAIAPSKF